MEGFHESPEERGEDQDVKGIFQAAYTSLALLAAGCGPRAGLRVNGPILIGHWRRLVVVGKPAAPLVMGVESGLQGTLLWAGSARTEVPPGIVHWPCRACNFNTDDPGSLLRWTYWTAPELWASTIRRSATVEWTERSLPGDGGRSVMVGPAYEPDNQGLLVATNSQGWGLSWWRASVSANGGLSTEPVTIAPYTFPFPVTASLPGDPTTYALLGPPPGTIGYPPIAGTGVWDSEDRLYLFWGLAGQVTSATGMWGFSPITSSWTWYGSPTTVPRMYPAITYAPEVGVFIHGGASFTTAPESQNPNPFMSSFVGPDGSLEIAHEVPVSLYDDLWSLNPRNGTWTRARATGPNGGHLGHTLLYDQTENRLLLAGGISGATLLTPWGNPHVNDAFDRGLWSLSLSDADSQWVNEDELPPPTDNSDCLAADFSNPSGLPPQCAGIYLGSTIVLDSTHSLFYKSVDNDLWKHTP